MQTPTALWSIVSRRKQPASGVPTKDDLEAVFGRLFGTRSPNFERRLENARRRAARYASKRPDLRGRLEELLCSPVLIAQLAYDRWDTLSAADQREILATLRGYVDHIQRLDSMTSLN